MNNTNFKPLPEREEQIMIVLWNAFEPLTLSEIQERLKHVFGLECTPQTTLTHIARLRNKGYLDDMGGTRKREYFSVVSVCWYRANILKHLIKHYYNGEIRFLKNTITLIEGGEL